MSDSPTVPLSTLAVRRFAVLKQSLLHDVYVVQDPLTLQPCAASSLASGTDWPQPLTWPLADAIAIAETFTLREPSSTWEPVRAPAPCPFCARDISVDDGDFCYPENRARTQWRAGCNEHDFGCGYEVVAPSRAAALDAWDRGELQQPFCHAKTGEFVGP